MASTLIHRALVPRDPIVLQTIQLPQWGKPIARPAVVARATESTGRGQQEARS